MLRQQQQATESLEAAEAEVEALKQRIDEVENADFVGHDSKLAKLREERQEIAAEVALGERSEADLTKIDARIRDVEELVRADQNTKANQKDILAGLRRKLEKAVRVAEARYNERSGLFEDWLRTESRKSVRIVSHALS